MLLPGLETGESLALLEAFDNAAEKRDARDTEEPCDSLDNLDASLLWDRIDRTLLLVPERVDPAVDPPEILLWTSKREEEPPFFGKGIAHASFRTGLLRGLRFSAVSFGDCGASVSITSTGAAAVLAEAG